MDDYRDVDAAVKKVVKAKLAAYNSAARKFIAKVDRGQARSTETYNELKAALAMPKKVSGYGL